MIMNKRKKEVTLTSDSHFLKYVHMVKYFERFDFKCIFKLTFWLWFSRRNWKTIGIGMVSGSKFPVHFWMAIEMKCLHRSAICGMGRDKPKKSHHYNHYASSIEYWGQLNGPYYMVKSTKYALTVIIFMTFIYHFLLTLFLAFCLRSFQQIRRWFWKPKWQQQKQQKSIDTAQCL